MELVDQRSDAGWLRSKYAASGRRVCGLMGIAVASYYYRTTRSEEPLRTRLVELAREKPRFGYRRLHVLLGRSGEQVNHKRVHRIYREAGLMIRRKKRKHCVREGKPLLARTAANQEWALEMICADFLAGANLDNADDEILQIPTRRAATFLPR
jgi:putative transposase